MKYLSKILGLSLSLFFIIFDNANSTPLFINTGEQLLVSNSTYPSWSPDGTKIAFYSNDTYTYTINPDGTGKTTLGQYLGYPDWSPDGTMLFTTGGPTGALWIINSDGTGKTQVGTYTSPFINAPQWSPNGSLSFFGVPTIGASWDIFTINTDGSNLTNMTIGSSWWETYHSWNPDGSKVAFATGDGHGIWIMDLDGNNRIEINPDYYARGPISWSPSGNFIAYSTYKDGVYDIWVMDKFGNNQTQLTNTPSDEEFHLDWSPDERAIVFSVWNNKNIYIMTIEPVFPDASIALVRQNQTTGSQRLLTYNAPLAVGEALSSPNTSYNWIGNTNQNNKVVITVTGDFDGDGVEEIGLVRENLTTGGQRLMLYEAPSSVGATLPAPFASYNWIGNAFQNNSVTHVVAGNFDADLTDEICLVRQNGTTGGQRLVCYDAPTSVGASLPGPISGFNWVGNSTQNNNIVYAVALDINSDGIKDEIGLVRQNLSTGGQRLMVYDPPLFVGDTLGVPTSSFDWIGNAYQNNNVVGIITGDFDSDGITDDIGIIRQNLTTGGQRLITYDGPIIPGEVLPAPISSYDWIGNANQNNNVIQATGSN